MAGKTAVLTVDIVADASAATKGLDDAGRAASSTADKIDDLGGKSGDTATGLSALSGALDMAGFGPAADALNLTATAMDAAEGASILFKVATDSLSLSTIKDTAARVANTVATTAASAATKAWAAVQWLLNAAMTANPIGLIIAAVVLLIGVIVLIATKTTWFQGIWTAVWSTVQKAAGAVWEWIVTKATWAWDLIVAGVRIYIGIYVGIFNGIKDAVGAVWEWIKDKAGTALGLILDPIRTVERAFDKVRSAVESVIDWIKRIKIPDAVKDAASWLGNLLPGGNAATGSGPAPGAAPPGVNALGATTRASASRGGGVTINLSVPEVSDPVATARYLKALIRRGEASGVLFGSP